MIERMGIFSIDNKDGKLGQETFYLLKEINEIVNELWVVSAGTLSKEEKVQIYEFSNGVFENIPGFDVNRWRFIIEKQNDGNKEIVLFNDSFFGPMYSLRGIFEDMKEKEVDFWGFTGSVDFAHRNHRFLHTYFMVFRKSAVQRLAFRDFWKKLPLIHNLEEYEKLVECRMTYCFENAGLKWCVYAETEDLDAEEKEKYVNQVLLSPHRMMEEKKLPILSKHCFMPRRELVLNYNNCSEVSQVMEYIRKYTYYDTQIIYQYFIKRFNVYDLKIMFNQCYVLSERKALLTIGFESVEANMGDKDNRRNAGWAAVYAHLFYEELFEKAVKYLNGVPFEIDIYITTDTDARKKRLKGCFSGKEK